MEPSASPPDSVHPSTPTNALELIREMYEIIDLDEQMRPSKKFKPSESMKPGHHGSPSPSPPTMEPSQSSPLHSIESIREMCQKIDPVKQIDPLISFIENHLRQMNTLTGSSSAECLLETVSYDTEFAAKIIEIISIEAEKLSKSDAVKVLGNVTLTVMKELGELHCVFIGLAVAAYTVENYLGFGSKEKDCSELLLNILELAKDVKQYSERMSYEREKLCNAVGTIMEAAIVCCDYMKRGTIFRFWSAMTAAAQLEKTNQQLGTDYGRGKDVFLSHSGKQKNFVRQLYRDLDREHVSCFFDEDDNSLPLGQKFPPLIFKAAETCKIAVVVLSKEFIFSKWPMLELSAFIREKNSGNNSKLKLLPIFFNISPNEVSHITKDSPEWKKFVESNDTTGDWQAALKEVRKINGLPLREDGNEVDCRDKAVKEICCFLKRINPPQLLDFEPVGIEKQVREVKALLEMDGARSALAVIVYGFGGVGKSTVAASVIQSLDWSSTDFKFCRVAIDEQTPDKTSHIIKLQENILYDLEGVKPNLRDPLEGRLQIKEALKKKCSLLFIDNVVDKNYIEDLLPKDLSSGEQRTKLRIIITSREKNVKAEFNITCKEIEVKGLTVTGSKSLLSKMILQSQVVKDDDLDEEHMINEVAAACRGVPLLLSVFGKHIRVARNMDSYLEALAVLREGNLDSYRDEDLGTKLMFVYNKIKDVDVKEAFLEICTFFHGWQWNLVADIVDFPILNDLQRRTLVSKSGSGEVIVHDILRLMGMKESKLNRFSNYKELSDAFPDVFSDSLENNLDGLENVKGILLDNNNCLITIKSTHLEAMHQSLRVLMLGDWVTLDGPPCQRAFRNLRYLRVGDITSFPFKDPSKLHNLGVLVNRSKPGMNLSHLPSSLKRIYHEVPYVNCDEFAKLPFQNLSSLKNFSVETLRSVKLPAALHLPASLVDLDLSRCKNVPKDTGHLTALQSLILDESYLERLPQGFGKLKKLKHLSMDYCSKLAFLAEELGMLSLLEALSMNDCENLRALPKSFGGLLSLQKLELIGCIKLQMLPESLGDLRIQKFKLSRLVNLQELPNSFGNMPLLKDLSLESCDSLMSLPDSFVLLKMLENLNIIKCTKLSVLSENFGWLRYLKHMTVEDCHLLKALPPGFGALPALKTLNLKRCNNFVNLPSDFTELTNLEELCLQGLPLISRIPDGFGKLKRLRILFVAECFQLKTLPNDFEYMATLEQLAIRKCTELEGAMMEKILRLQNCTVADIKGSVKLVQKWEQMQSQIEHPILVFSGDNRIDREVEKRVMVALLNGKCVELNNTTGQLMEHSSLLVGLEEGKRATVALIMLPIRMQPHQQQILQLFVKMASERAKTNGSVMLQIVCARKLVWSAQRRTPTEEEEIAELVWSAQRRTPTEEEEIAEEEDIHQILLSLPKGSCAIPSAEFKRVKIITRLFLSRQFNDYSHEEMFTDVETGDPLFKLSFLMATVEVDMEACKSYRSLKFMNENYFRRNGEPFPSEISEAESEQYNSIQDFIESICPQSQSQSVVGGSKNEQYNSIQNFIEPICPQSQSQCVVGESKTRELMEALKGNGIHYLFIHNNNNSSKVMVDDLHGKTIGLIICDFEFLVCIKLQQIYKDLQEKDSNFIAIWIPTVWPESCGHGTYTRLIQCMPWATFPYPKLVNIESIKRHFVVLDKGGQIANRDALGLLLAWGVKFYPFTQHTISESCFLMESDSCLEFLLLGMNVVGRKRMKSKMTFLYAERPNEWHKMKCKLEELTQIHGNFEVLYVGRFSSLDISCYDIEYLQQEYEAATEQMLWPSLSFSDMIIFWNRCRYLAMKVGFKESHTMMEILHGLANHADHLYYASLLLVDNDGLVTRHGYDVLQMICKLSDEISNGEGMAMRMVKVELRKSLSRGECTPFIKTLFRDEIDNLPQHPHHHLFSPPYPRPLLFDPPFLQQLPFPQFRRFIISQWGGEFTCGLCDVRVCQFEECGEVIQRRRSYRCKECKWDMCASCWMAIHYMNF